MNVAYGRLQAYGMTPQSTSQYIAGWLQLAAKRATSAQLRDYAQQAADEYLAGDYLGWSVKGQLQNAVSIIESVAPSVLRKMLSDLKRVGTPDEVAIVQAHVSDMPAEVQQVATGIPTWGWFAASGLLLLTLGLGIVATRSRRRY